MPSEKRDGFVTIPLDRLKLREDLSKYLNRAREINKNQVQNLLLKLDDLLTNQEFLDDKAIRERIEMIRKDAITLMARADSITEPKAYDLARDILSGSLKL